MSIVGNKFDIICNTLDNGIILINKNLEVKFWNRWLEIRTGISSSNIVDNKLTDFYSNIDEKKLVRKIGTALKLNSSTFYTPQISKFLLDIELGKITDRVFDNMQQSITITPFDIEEELVIIYIYDITMISEINYQLNEVKEEVQEKNEKLKLLLDATMEAIILFKDDLIIDCNQIAVELFNYSSKEELLNKDLKKLIFNKKILEKIHDKPIEANILREDKTSFKALINIKDTNHNSQIFKILTIVDVSEIRRKENLLAEQTKLAAMGEMMGNIAHQWRQPLNIISITASGTKIKKELDLLTDEFLLDSLKQISDTTAHLSDTIDVFKDFFKDNKEKSLFNLSQNISNTLSLLESILKENRILVNLNLDNDIYIYNFANEFSQAIINILHNANDAIKNKLDADDIRIINISTRQEKNKAIIEITDNAGGIAKDVIKKIFEPYFTTKHKYQGTGLGLYMTHKIIKMSMKGSISVSNKKVIFEDKTYKGANFRISLVAN
ncbi:MAG: ATP-binding protein [Aliarcobacter sp.]|jgi:signal transduction histidine kinase|nr:ATP-binding protein [Aliarcobacter sp.]